MAKSSYTVREQRPGESDLAYFKALAKQADQRLVRIEKYANEPYYKGMLQYAYANAMYDIKALSGDPDVRRFNRVPASTRSGAINMRNLHAKINAVKKFLEAPTSTKQGLTKIYKKRADTINHKYGTEFTWQELAAYYSNESNRVLDSQYGSATMLLVLDAMKKSHNNEPDKIRDAAASDRKVSADMVINEVALNLEAQGLTVNDLI